MPAKDILFGVDVYMQKKDIGNFKSILKIPFGKYRISGEKQDKIITIHTQVEPIFVENEISV